MGDLDSAAKVLLRNVPGTLVTRFLPGYRLAPGRPPGVPTELVWSKRAVDHVVAVTRGKTRAALHVEVSATPEPDCPVRVLGYNVGLRSVGFRRVVSVAIYLKPGERRRVVKDEVEDDGAGVSPLGFTFESIRLWNEDARRLLREKGMGLLPFLPYARGSTPRLVERALDRLRRRVQQPGRRADLMAALATFANDRFPDVQWFAMIPEEIQMRSKFLQQLEARGRAHGKREVLQIQLDMRLGSRAEKLGPILERAKPSELDQMSRLLADPSLSEDELFASLRLMLPRRASNGRKPTPTRPQKGSSKPAR